MEISRMLTISTGHVSKKTAKLLDHHELNIIVYLKKEYGWFIYLPANILNNNYTSDNKDDNYYVPEELLKLMKFAKNLDCDWLCIDCDGEELDDFEIFDW